MIGIIGIEGNPDPVDVPCVSTHLERKIVLPCDKMLRTRHGNIKVKPVLVDLSFLDILETWPIKFLLLQMVFHYAVIVSNATHFFSWL